MPQGQTRRGRPHCEAFPKIDILRAEQAGRVGQAHCEWSSEQGEVAGQGRLLALSGEAASFSFEFFGSANIARAADEISFQILESRRNPHVIRKSFVCPRCASSVQSVFWFTGAWACRACHNLVYAKQRLGTVNKRLHWRDELLSEILQVPAKRQRTRWFHNRRRHVECINRELVEEGFEALPQELLFRTYDP